jgi:hypothetical protein
MENDAQRIEPPQRRIARNGTQSNARTLPTDPLQRRIAQLRRTFAQGIGGKANAAQAVVIQNAAVLSARAEAAALDPACTINQLVRAENLARRSRADMRAMLRDEREPAHDDYSDEAMALVVRA